MGQGIPTRRWAEGPAKYFITIGTEMKMKRLSLIFVFELGSGLLEMIGCWFRSICGVGEFSNRGEKVSVRQFEETDNEFINISGIPKQRSEGLFELY